MRTLIIDNYDSFTYNLVHYVAEVTGVEPVVVRNDDPAFRVEDLDRFDNVVISPGPGRPQRAADFGVCADVIAAGQLPVLGVCLGHQGICHLFGATVGPAPEVYHGRLSRISHGGTDLFAGLPSPFDAVRYHSLAVTDLPDELEPTAWTDDGVLMAVRHRTKPLWGVQFHPESICTEHGHRLLANFTELSGRRRAAPPVRAVSRESAEPALRVRHRRLDVAVDAERVFDALYRDSDRSFWLDSADRRGAAGRFSIMGDASGPLARVVTADVWRGRLTVESTTGTETVAGSFFDWLDADLAAHRVVPPDLPFDFALGWVGYLGYELKAECGGARAHRSANPDAAMIFADRALVFDHATGAVYLLALDGNGAQEWLAGTAERLLALAGGDALPPPPAGSADLGALSLRHDRARYLELIGECQRQMALGETYEVCLTNLVTADGKLDPWQSYRLLRARNPAPFAALLRFGLLSVLSSSPERFLRVGRDRVAEARPIKGTRRRSADPVLDAALRADLAGNAKDRAENLMIVDLVRNDLGSTAELGSVVVDALFDVESYATVHQLVSTVRATLRPDTTAVRCVRAAFPGGSMTGAPKIRTMRIIDRLEDGPRGVYSGALGYFSLCGAADFGMVIRTLVAAPGWIEYGTGGAIVALSDPADEFDETVVKATPLTQLLDRGFPAEMSTVDRSD
jgi:para-aminobenzoate synthetase